MWAWRSGRSPPSGGTTSCNSSSSPGRAADDRTRQLLQSLLRSRQFQPQDDAEDVFVVTCFAVARQARRAGIGRALLSAAVDRALERGASAVEGYPGAPPDYKGRAEWFVDYGFVPVRRAGKRTVMRFTP